MHTYKRTENGRFNVGYYFPDSHHTLGGANTSYEWQTLEEFDDEADARKLVNYLNGGNTRWE